MKKALLIAICILLAAPFVSSQEYKGQGRIAGIVSDEQGKPIEGVKVKLFCPQWNGGFDVVTDKDGKWTGAWMRSGMWNVDFSKIGYMPLKKSFQMNQLLKTPEMRVVLTKVEGLVITDEMKKDLTAANEIYDKKDYPAAVEAYKGFLVKYPEAYVIWLNVGNCYFVQEKYDDAEKAYREVLAKESSNVEANISIGNCYANRGDTDKALEWFTKVPLEKIHDSTSLYFVGVAYFKASKLESAVEYLKKAVEVDESNLDALYQLGLTYTALQNKDEAIVLFEKYIKLDADSDRAGQVKGFLDYLRKK